MLNFQITKLHPPKSTSRRLFSWNLFNILQINFGLHSGNFQKRQYKICETNRRLLSKLINSANYFPAA